MGCLHIGDRAKIGRVVLQPVVVEEALEPEAVQALEHGFVVKAPLAQRLVDAPAEVFVHQGVDNGTNHRFEFGEGSQNGQVTTCSVEKGGVEVEDHHREATVGGHGLGAIECVL